MFPFLIKKKKKASNFEENLVSSFEYQSHDFQECWAAQLKSATPASVQNSKGQILWTDLQDAKNLNNRFGHLFPHQNHH